MIVAYDPHPTCCVSTASTTDIYSFVFCKAVGWLMACWAERNESKEEEKILVEHDG